MWTVGSVHDREKRVKKITDVGKKQRLGDKRVDADILFYFF